MAVNIAKYLDFSATQGANDAFVESSIVTNLIPANGFAFKVMSLWFDINNPMAAVNQSYVEMSLTRDTKLAVAKYDDPDTLFYRGLFTSFLTSGFAVEPTGNIVRFEEGVYIVEPSVYFQLDSNLTGGVHTVHGRIYYEEVKLSEVDILRLLNNM